MLTPGQIIMNQPIKKSCFFFLFLSNLEFTLSCTCLQVHIHCHIIFNGCTLSKILCTKCFSTLVLPWGVLLEDLLLQSQTYYLSKIVSLSASSECFQASTRRTYLCCFCKLLNKYLFIYLLLFFTLTIKQKKIPKIITTQARKKMSHNFALLRHTIFRTFGHSRCLILKTINIY